MPSLGSVGIELAVVSLGRPENWDHETCSDYPLVNIQKNNGKIMKDLPCLVGKLTISMAIFKSYVSHSQRVAIKQLSNELLKGVGLDQKLF